MPAMIERCCNVCRFSICCCLAERMLLCFSPSVAALSCLTCGLGLDCGDTNLPAGDTRRRTNAPTQAPFARENSHHHHRLSQRTALRALAITCTSAVYLARGGICTLECERAGWWWQGFEIPINWPGSLLSGVRPLR